MLVHLGICLNGPAGRYSFELSDDGQRNSIPAWALKAAWFAAQAVAQHNSSLDVPHTQIWRPFGGNEKELRDRENQSQNGRSQNPKTDVLINNAMFTSDFLPELFPSMPYFMSSEPRKAAEKSLNSIPG